MELLTLMISCTVLVISKISTPTHSKGNSTAIVCKGEGFICSLAIYLVSFFIWVILQCHLIHHFNLFICFLKLISQYPPNVLIVSQCFHIKQNYGSVPLTVYVYLLTKNPGESTFS